MTRQSKNSSAKNPEIPGSSCPRDDERSVNFLGHNITQAEYEESCRNLAEFFALLRAWRKDKADESPEL